MALHLQADYLLAVFLASVRASMLLLMSPVFTGLQGMVVVRVLFSVALGALLGASHPAPGLSGLSGFGLALATAGEVAIGMALAFGVLMAFGAFAVAGQILDVQIGLGMGGVYDPVTRSGGPLFGMLLGLLGLAVFFSLDGHHVLLRGLAYSLHQVPPGQGLRMLSADVVVAHFGLMFSLGVALVAPVLLCLLLMEAGLAVISKMLPQMNVFAVSVPVKMVAGFSVLLVCLRTLESPLGRVYASIFQFWQGVLP